MIVASFARFLSPNRGHRKATFPDFKPYLSFTGRSCLSDWASSLMKIEASPQSTFKDRSASATAPHILTCQWAWLSSHRNWVIYILGKLPTQYRLLANESKLWSLGDSVWRDPNARDKFCNIDKCHDLEPQISDVVSNPDHDPGDPGSLSWLLHSGLWALGPLRVQGNKWLSASMVQTKFV